MIKIEAKTEKLHSWTGQSVQRRDSGETQPK